MVWLTKKKCGATVAWMLFYWFPIMLACSFCEIKSNIILLAKGSSLRYFSRHARMTVLFDRAERLDSFLEHFNAHDYGDF